MTSRPPYQAERFAGPFEDHLVRHPSETEEALGNRRTRSESGTYRFDGAFQAEDLLLEQVQRAGLAAVAGEGGGAGRVDAVDPRVQFRLARSL